MAALTASEVPCSPLPLHDDTPFHSHPALPPVHLPRSAAIFINVSLAHSEAEGGAETGTDGEGAGGVAAHGPRLVHGRHPQRRPGDGKPQPGLLATRVQVHDGSPHP